MPNKQLQVYCGHKCSNMVTNRKLSERLKVNLVCAACKKEFTKRPSDLKIYPGSLSKNKHKYCSKKCEHEMTRTVTSIKKKAWAAFSLYIKNRDNWTCFTCGKYERSSNMHAGHFISRRHNSTLFDERNVHAQCSLCNAFRNGEPHIYAEKLINIYGHAFLLEMIAKSKQIKKFTRQELLDICTKYANEIKPYEEPGKSGFG